MVNITVSYATPEKQVEIALSVDAHCIVQTAIEQSGVLQQFPEIDLSKNLVGIFNKRITLKTEMQEGDRVEIYRALLIDPKEARRRRVLEE